VELSAKQLEDQNLGDQLALAAGAFDLPRSAVLPLIDSDQTESAITKLGETLEQLASIDVQIAISGRSLKWDYLDAWSQARPRFLQVPCQLLLDQQGDSSAVQQRRDLGLETVARDIVSAEQLARLQGRGIAYGMGPYFKTISPQ
jgi:EAL domain-containing protein (putative c-di-GMP-specific phosphodiesterase class I)